MLGSGAWVEHDVVDKNLGVTRLSNNAFKGGTVGCVGEC